MVTCGPEVKEAFRKRTIWTCWGKLSQSPVFPETGRKELLLLSQVSSPPWCSQRPSVGMLELPTRAGAQQGAEAVVPVLVLGGKHSSRWLFFFHSGHDAL